MRRYLVLLGALVPVLLGAGPASAAAPMDLTSPLTDIAVLLDADERNAFREATDQLSAEYGIGLNAVFVSTFDSIPAEDWVERTAELSQLAESDILFAVAVGNGTYEYAWWVDVGFPLLEADVDAAMSGDVEPELAARDWAGAVTTLAGQLRSVASQTEATATAEAAAAAAGEEAEGVAPWSPPTILLIIGGIAVVLLGAHVLSRRRMPPDKSVQDRIAT